MNLIYSNLIKKKMQIIKDNEDGEIANFIKYHSAFKVVYRSVSNILTSCRLGNSSFSLLVVQ